MDPIEFIKANPPKKRKSKLSDYVSEIILLYEKNYQIEQIQEWLATKKL